MTRWIWTFDVPFGMDDPCCPDVTKRACFMCRRDVRIRLHTLAVNLAVAAALCNAYWLGWYGRSCETTPGSFTSEQYWSPGCGRPQSEILWFVVGGS